MPRDRTSKTKVNPRRYSSEVVDGLKQAPSRAMLRAVGYKDGDFKKPAVGATFGPLRVKKPAVGATFGLLSLKKPVVAATFGFMTLPIPAVGTVLGSGTVSAE